MKLTVKPLKQKDAGRGLAAIDEEDMADLGVEDGDYVRIKNGDAQTVARVWTGYQEDARGIVRIDGQLRQAAKAGIDETVTVETADVAPAESITISLPRDLDIRGELESHIRSKLKGQAVSQGETISFSVGVLGAGNQSYSMKIISAQPAEQVVVTDSTTVNVSDTPIEDLGSDEDSETDGEPTHPNVTYEDIGGLNEEIRQVREMTEIPMEHPELFKQIGVEPPTGVLLHGPPGTGKTLLAEAVANEVDAHFEKISGPEIMSKHYGDSEENLRALFETAEENSPAIIFIDEIDSIAPDRNDTRGNVEKRVVAQLLDLMDGLGNRGDVTVLAATNRADAIDPALRRGGRFDREVEIGVPDRDERKQVLQVHTREMPLGENVDLGNLADNTHGFVGADFRTLTKEAAMNALDRVIDDLNLEQETVDIPTHIVESISVTRGDFKEALKDVEPSALREVFVEVPDVEWDDVGGLDETKTALQETIEWPLEYPDLFEDYDVEAAKGILMYGPPGTGKTLLAKAVANESNSNFISLKGPELLSKWVGESEEGIREVFSKARENAPTIIFFDEIDAIATNRNGDSGGGSAVTDRVVSQLLTELDGLEELEDVVVIATTNRPDILDDALLRPGRFDRRICVSVPDREARREIFRVHAENKPVADNVDIDWLVEQTDGYVGADIEAICREASMTALREEVQRRNHADGDERTSPALVTRDHFERALNEIDSSVTDDVLQRFEEFEEQYSSNRSLNTDDDSPDRLYSS